jgi:hypothetical protein
MRGNQRVSSHRRVGFADAAALFPGMGFSE